MNVTCPECSSVFRVDPAKVPAGGVRARCSVCSGIIQVPAPGAGAAPRYTPSQPVGAEARGDYRTGEFSRTSGMPWSGGAESHAPHSTPPSLRREGTAPPRSSVPASPPPPQVLSTSTPSSPTAPQSPTPSSPAQQRRPINPFLAKDPNLRARRLARALVSDIITYHPAKHAEGLRDGTIRDLFKEEIRKSYEEYSAQVGQQLADSTPYFQEALNEVLGAGKKIF